MVLESSENLLSSSKKKKNHVYGTLTFLKTHFWGYIYKVGIHHTCILGDPGAVTGSGVGKCLNGREQNSGNEKSRRRVRAPGDKVLTHQFQTVGAVLDSDWCEKIFVFFCPITEQ